MYVCVYVRPMYVCIIIIIIEAFIKRRTPGKTTCSKAPQYRGSYKN